jgi:hypothetical protein
VWGIFALSWGDLGPAWMHCYGGLLEHLRVAASADLLFFFKEFQMSWGCGSVAELLSSMHSGVPSPALQTKTPVDTLVSPAGDQKPLSTACVLTHLNLSPEHFHFGSWVPGVPEPRSLSLGLPPCQIWLLGDS